MELAAAGLQEQPFRIEGKSPVYVALAPQAAATVFLQETVAHKHGLGLFEGPALSGKSTIISEFVASIDDDTAVAVVDGAGLGVPDLLSDILGQFGYELPLHSVNELLSMLRVFVLQQASAKRPPLLIVENTHAMHPGALQTLCDLAELRSKDVWALKIILTSDRSIETIVSSPAMQNIGSRVTGSFVLDCFSVDETKEYLFTKLRSGGCEDPFSIVPQEVCEQVHHSSGGWPGIIDKLVAQAIQNAEQCPLEKIDIEAAARTPELPALTAAATDDSEAKSDPDAPTLYLTLNGETLHQITMHDTRLLIGRADYNDLCINSKFISRHHAMFVRHGKATILMDLNSTNGTFVNSRRVSNHVMQHDDIVTLGQHGIKFVYPGADQGLTMDSSGFTDTVILKSLRDIRKLLAKEKTAAVPAQPDAVDAADGGTPDQSAG
jgi:type II secretory pathway predicted ATPase ExeA